MLLGAGDVGVRLGEGSMISILLSLVCAASVVFAHGAWAGEKLAYAVVYKGSNYTGIKTEILSIDPETAEKRLIFSDKKTSILLLQRLYVFHFPVVGGRKLFAHAVNRGESIPFPGNGALYELSADGSNLFRRINHVLGTESLRDIFVNSRGTRIGYINRMNRKQYLFIHDVVTGELLYQVDMTNKFLDCFASSIGWLPGSDKLYFSLETGDADLTSEASYARVGTYFMDERGEYLTKLRGLPPREGFFPRETVRMIGVLPSGEYILETMQHKKRPSHERNRYIFAVLKVKKDFLDVEDMSFSPAAKLYSGIRVSYQLSPSGKYLSAARLPVSASAFSCDVWLKNLQAGTERRILSLPTEGLQGPFLGLVGWLD
jgi:hypothetical protein